LNTPFVIPSDMQRQLNRVSSDQREEVRIQVEDRIKQVLDEQVRPIECFAVARYALAARAAKAGAIDNEYTRTAADRLQAYGEERIAQCVAEAQKADASFGAYQAGEFARSPRGQNLQVETGAAPPPLAPLEGR
jgi:cellulose synthase operon protein C